MAVIKKDGGYMALPISIRRGNPIPLDESAIWYSYDEMKAYAETSATAYVGQVLSLVDEENNKATAYIITNAAGELLEIGTGASSSISADGKSITLTDDVVSLKNFGARYYKWIEAVEADEENGIEAVEAHYELTEGWIDGLEPKSFNGELAWYQPNPTTAEGLQSQMSSLQTRIDALASATSVRGEVESLDDVENPQNGDIYFVGDKEYVYAATTEHPEGEFIELGSTTDLSEYLKSADAESTYAKAADVTALETQVTNLETATSGLSTVESNVEDLMTLVGTAATSEDETSTGLVARIEALESVGAEKNIITSISANNVALTPVNGNVNIDVFSGSLAGLVPVVAEELTETEKAGLFLNANGAWVAPADDRIGSLTYNEQEYSSIEDYIEARMADLSFEWENINE